MAASGEAKKEFGDCPLEESTALPSDIAPALRLTLRTRRLAVAELATQRVFVSYTIPRRSVLSTSFVGSGRPMIPAPEWDKETIVELNTDLDFTTLTTNKRR